MLAGDILKEASDRAVPLVADRPDVPPRLLPPADRRLRLAARVLGRDRPGPRARRAGHRRRRRAAHGHRARSSGATSSPRCGASTSAACRCCCSTPTGRRTRVADRWITSRLYVGDPEVRLWQYALLASAACACCTRSASSPASSTSTRATRRSRASRSPAPPPSAAPPRRGRPRRRARAHGLHHPHAGPGRQRHLPGRADRRRARAAGRRPRARDGRARPPRPHAPGRGGRAVRRHPVRAPLEPPRQRRLGPPRRGRARDVARPVAGPRLEDVPIGHVTNGVHIPTWIGNPMRELFDRHLGAGWMDHATDPAVWAAADALPADELWAARCAQRRELIDLVRDRSVDRPPRPRRHARVRAHGGRHARPRRADARLRPPRRDLQAARPAAQRGRPRDRRCSATTTARCR